jgi:hypothetical protein
MKVQIIKNEGAKAVTVITQFDNGRILIKSLFQADDGITEQGLYISEPTARQLNDILTTFFHEEVE